MWIALKLLGSEAHRTTSYHPQTNGIVGKAALKARLDGPHWMDELHLVMLGIHIAPKEDLQCSAADLVYGEILRLPDEFYEIGQTPIQASEEFLPQLWRTMQKVQPTPTAHHGGIVPHVPAALQTSKFIFVRKDGHKTPLQCPYEGPFQVLDCSDKFFTLQMNGKIDTVSIDHLQPAFLETVCQDTDSGQTSSSSPSSTPSIVLQRTPSGWTVQSSRHSNYPLPVDS